MVIDGYLLDSVHGLVLDSIPLAKLLKSSADYVELLVDGVGLVVAAFTLARMIPEYASDMIERTFGLNLGSPEKRFCT